MIPRPDVIGWLLDSDPAIRWQVLKDLTDASPDVVATERARVAHEGWGRRLLDLQGDDGRWAGGVFAPTDFSWSNAERDDEGRLKGQPWTATLWSLLLLWQFGIDPAFPEVRRAVGKVEDQVVWEFEGRPFFAGEGDVCINGRTVGIGSYFGKDVSGIVERLLGEQMADGGWNCEQESGSTRGSFHTTISVLEGLWEFEQRNRQAVEVSTARRAGEDYLLERRMLRRKSDGELVNKRFTEFSFPTYWHYDVLRGLDYFRGTGSPADARLDEALTIVVDSRSEDGCWARQRIHPGAIHFDIDAAEGEPSRWITLRANRVLEWAGVN